MIWLHSNHPIVHLETEWLLPFVPNSHFAYTFSKGKEMVICMGQRNGTISSKQALKELALEPPFS